MVTPGGALREFADHWTPIFADPQRRYDHAAAVTSHEPVEGGVRLSLRTEGGETLRLDLALRPLRLPPAARQGPTGPLPRLRRPS